MSGWPMHRWFSLGCAVLLAMATGIALASSALAPASVGVSARYPMQ